MSKPLTIARGLRRAKQLKGRVAELSSRLSGTTSWKDGDKPDFTFEETLEEHDKAVAELVNLRTDIARANAVGTIAFEGETIVLTKAIRLQDELKGRITLFKGFDLRQGSDRVHTGYDDRSRAVYEVVTHEAVWTERDRAEKIEALRARLETLNELLEEANHTTRLER